MRTQTILTAAALLMASALLGLGIFSPPSRAVQAQNTTTAKIPADALPSWNEGPSKKAIVAFVEKVTKEGGPDFIPVAERLAVFDNDGTLWCEHPMYVQMAFVIDRVKALAPKHPEWKEKEPFNAVLEADLKKLAAAGKRDSSNYSWRRMQG
jgi:hypothetical protein